MVVRWFEDPPRIFRPAAVAATFLVFAPPFQPHPRLFAMALSSLCYRGLPYDHSRFKAPSDVPVEHVYRGQHYVAPLRHEPSEIDEARDLIYRGTHHHPHHALA
jgi:hypothetical protein